MLVLGLGLSIIGQGLSHRGFDFACTRYVLVLNGHGYIEYFTVFNILVQTGCRRADTTICPRPSPLSVGAEAPRTAELTAAPGDGNVAVGSHGEYFPTLTAASA